MVPCHFKERGQFLLRPPFQFKRVESPFAFGKGGFLPLVQMGRAHQPPVRRQRGAVELLDPPAYADLPLELEGGEEVVLERVPIVLVNIVHRPLEFLPVEPLVAEQFPDVRVVLLFDVAVVVLFVGARPGKDDALPPELVEDPRIEELASRVGIDGDDAEGQVPLDAVEARGDLGGVFGKHRPVLRPGRIDVGERQGAYERAPGVLPAVGDGIDLDMPGTGDG